MARQPRTLPDQVLADLGPTLQLAAVLAGSTPGAIELVAETLATGRSGVRGTAEDDSYDTAPRLRADLVRTFLSSPLGRSHPPAVATGLDALTGPARTAVVLRDAEQLITGEIAAIMDRPRKRVADHLAAVPPGRHDAEIAELAALAPSAAEAGARWAATARRYRRRRRARTALLAAAAATVAVALAVPTVILPGLPHEVRPTGAWRFSHEVRVPDGWRIRYRTISSDTEVTAVSVPWPDKQRVDCTITVTVPGEEPRLSGPTRPTRVGGRPGVLVDGPGDYLALNWQYADDAWVAVDCLSAPPTESQLRRIADTVRFRDNRLLLPFTLTGLPDRYRIRMVGYTDEAPDWGPFVVLDPPRDSYWPVLLIGPHTSEGESVDGAERCLGTDKTICVTAAQSDDQVTVDPRVQRYVLSGTVALIRVAADPADRTTWFDAVDLPSS